MSAYAIDPPPAGTVDVVVIGGGAAGAHIDALLASADADAALALRPALSERNS
ncbi:hypothetical protein [Nonomuraea fuscirosea]|uniref:hypothetical protein n=1 Tax=Nonomuraea fuscirosea TaxID=1291556 RepID=UPI003440F996